MKNREGSSKTKKFSQLGNFMRKVQKNIKNVQEEFHVFFHNIDNIFASYDSILNNTFDSYVPESKDNFFNYFAPNQRNQVSPRNFPNISCDSTVGLIQKVEETQEKFLEKQEEKYMNEEIEW